MQRTWNSQKEEKNRGLTLPDLKAYCKFSKNKIVRWWVNKIPNDTDV